MMTDPTIEFLSRELRRFEEFYNDIYAAFMDSGGDAKLADAVYESLVKMVKENL